LQWICRLATLAGFGDTTIIALAGAAERQSIQLFDKFYYGPNRQRWCMIYNGPSGNEITYLAL
jgi:hypothetical protein